MFYWKISERANTANTQNFAVEICKWRHPLLCIWGVLVLSMNTRDARNDCLILLLLDLSPIIRDTFPRHLRAASGKKGMECSLYCGGKLGWELTVYRQTHTVYVCSLHSLLKIVYMHVYIMYIYFDTRRTQQSQNNNNPQREMRVNYWLIESKTTRRAFLCYV